ncbi:hypothetical protein AUR64_14745 [Haloprofundus marisrubri]|uniref:DUF7847 domain-containing protein n=1 Tax=Haloprofundus marisrubri TaxID=1514971 RepID=A0A0W1R773_9EURY|nr:hypothetical protein [Haloprofundus marisrubri]KTG09057.1 hypothetical protein AUR64_14745 [Haloprofundus marisrubri]
MAVLNALRNVPGALVRNPILVAIVGLFGLLQAPQLLAQYVSPLLSIVVSLLLLVVYVFGTPFVQGGMIGMADEALKTKTRFETFVQAGKRHYVSLLAAYLLVAGVALVLMVGLFIAIFAGVFSAATGSQTGLLIGGGIGLVVGLVYLVFAFFIQFYSHEIVLNGQSAISGLKGSVGLVRRNLLSTTGYFLVTFGGMFIVVGAMTVAQMFLMPQPSMAAATAAPAQLSLTSTLAQIVLSTVLTAIIGSVGALYSVAFYREIREQKTASVDSTPSL